jgi:hypothetical protein
VVTVQDLRGVALFAETDDAQLDELLARAD